MSGIVEANGFDSGQIGMGVRLEGSELVVQVRDPIEAVPLEAEVVEE